MNQFCYKPATKLSAFLSDRGCSDGRLGNAVSGRCTRWLFTGLRAGASSRGVSEKVLHSRLYLTAVQPLPHGMVRAIGA
jgi:hypothetical protein